MSTADSPILEPVPVPPMVPAPVPAGRPWGFWATLGFSVLILLAWLAVQIGVVVVYFLAIPSGRALFKEVMKSPNAASAVGEEGTLLAIVGTSTGILLPPLCIFFAWLKRGISVRDYLGLRNVSLGQWLCWSGVCLLFCAASDSANWLLGRPIVPPWMDNVYRSTAFLPLLWFAVVIGAPLFEEFLFRGFALPGFRYSWLGSVGAVVVTSLGWTALHTQYELIDLADLFLCGLLLGYARIRSGSLLVPIGMHALNNLWATIEAAIKLHLSQ
jgi:membrane protease YdiL (CAAX protease family)